MSSKKNNSNKHNNDDLNFIPLNIETPLEPNGAKFSLLFNINGFAMTQGLENNPLNLPILNMDPIPAVIDTKPPVDAAPLTPYPNNIPSLNSKTSINSNTDLNNNNTTIDLEYPDELEDDFLYSYNEHRFNDNYLNNSINPVDILRNFDISTDDLNDLRAGKYTDKDIDNIFSSIEKNNSGILATMKAYRIPYPIAKLLIKKIIKLSLDNYIK